MSKLGNQNAKGNPPNRTSFKKGQCGPLCPSWKSGVQKPINDCVFLSVGDGKRVRRPVKAYEEHYGKIPDGLVIFHLDGNKYNDHPENLKAITRSELINLNRKP